MARYHVNFQGNPGLCKAQVACPFGSADEHYSSEVEARTAYEASMQGEEVRVYRRKLIEEAHAKEARLEAKEARRIEPATQVPTYDYDQVHAAVLAQEMEKVPQPKYGRVPKLMGELEVGDTLNGEEILALDRRNSSPYIYFTTASGEKRLRKQSEAPGHTKQSDVLNANEIHTAQWEARRAADQAVADAKEAVRMAEAERTLEDSTLNDLPRSRSKLRDELAHAAQDFRWMAGHRARTSSAARLSTAVRIYSSKVKDFKQNGVSHPHTRALEHLRQVVGRHREDVKGLETYVGYRDVELLTAMLEKSSRFAPDREQRKALETLAPDHPLLGNPPFSF